MTTRQVTIKDIAKRLGISHSTVSRALSPSASYLVNDVTKRLVRQTADEMEYTPNLMAKGFVTGKTWTLGLVTFRIALENYGRRIEDVLRTAANEDYHVLMGMSVARVVGTLREDQGLQIKGLISRGIDGLLIDTRGDPDESKRIHDIVRNRLPVVTFLHPTEQTSGVVLDLAADFYAATAHLIALGHRRIGFIGMKLDENRPKTYKAKGYISAMRDHDLPHEIVVAGGPQGAGGYKQGRILKDRFTAIVCRNDYTAIGLCRGLRDSGLRIPDDVAVVGRGDLQISRYLSPSLTTLSDPSEQISRSVLDLMLRQLEGESSVQQIKLRSRLIVRESCGGNKA